MRIERGESGISEATTSQEGRGHSVRSTMSEHPRHPGELQRIDQPPGGQVDSSDTTHELALELNPGREITATIKVDGTGRVSGPNLTNSQ